MKIKWLVFILLCYPFLSSFALPRGFVYLSQYDPTILQEMRYASHHNFIGRPIYGYERATCILSLPAAEALHSVQDALRPYGLCLKVYDCYRPSMSVHDFYTWSQKPEDHSMQQEFYPRTPKNQLFNEGYIARHSGHSRGSTVDLTIVALGKLTQATFKPGQVLAPCYAHKMIRFQDNSLDMGSGYDCLDKVANYNDGNISHLARANRRLLRRFMGDYGFVPYEKEWWHFTLQDEPYPKQYFNFPVK